MAAGRRGIRGLAGSDAGMKQRVVGGHRGHQDYQAEATSCVLAFMGYDDAGWPAGFARSGSGFGIPPLTASNRFCRNHRDGVFADMVCVPGVGVSKAGARGVS